MKVLFSLFLLIAVIAYFTGVPTAAERKNKPQGRQSVGDIPGKASALVKQEVRNEAGEQLGDIKDLMLNVRDGRVQYMVLGAGGFLGLGNKLIALPATALHKAKNGEHLVLEADQKSLQAAPGIKSNNWPEMADTSWLNERDRHYSQHVAAAAKEDAISEAAGADRDVAKEGGTNAIPLVAPEPLKYTEIVRTKVLDEKGERVGEVVDAAVELETGTVRYLVIANDDEKLFAISPALFRKQEGEKNVLRLLAASDTFKQAKSFSSNDWPETADQAFEKIDEAAGTPNDPRSDGRTALDQSNAKRDIMITQQLRRAIIKDPTMSLTTQNITIITADGVITVRGRVDSQRDVDRILAFAHEIAGNKVVNELRIKQNKGETNETAKPEKN